MKDRQTMERLVRELHAARVGGEYNQLCGLFTDDAHFRIAGSSGGAPIEISVNGIAEIRPWLRSCSRPSGWLTTRCSRG